MVVALTMEIDQTGKEVDFQVENGLIKQADFIIPTVHNMLAIRRALTVAAKRYVSKDGISAELEKAVGRVVRAFDPCIACATK